METLSVLWGNAGRPLADGPGCDGEVGAGVRGWTTGSYTMTIQDSDLVLFINTLRWEATFGAETVASYVKSRSLPKSIVESKACSPMLPGLIIHACFAQYQQVDMITTGHGLFERFSALRWYRLPAGSYVWITCVLNLFEILFHCFDSLKMFLSRSKPKGLC